MHVKKEVPGGVSGFFTGTGSALVSGLDSALGAGLVFDSTSSFVLVLDSGCGLAEGAAASATV